MDSELKPHLPHSAQPDRLSLYHTVLNAVGEQVSVLALTKATLVHLSHTLEDIVLTQRLPALIFTGFQESSYWRKETARYEHLAAIAKQVCIFAGRPLPKDGPAHALQITLDDNDPARQEWFLTILSGQFSVVLCGLDRVATVTSEAYRRFDTIWSFEPAVVSVALDAVEGLLEKYRPARAAELREARSAYPLRPPDARVLSQFTSELITFEEKLNQRLRRTTESLSESEALLRMVVISAPILLIATDTRGVVTFFDWHGVPQLQQVAEPLVGQPIKHLHEDIPQIDTIHARALEGQRARTLITTAKGVTVEIHAAPVHDTLGNVTGAVLVLVDVSSRVAADEARQRQQLMQSMLEQERELSRVKDRIMRIVSHEFRNPLATISTTVDLLQNFNHALNEGEQATYLSKIQNQVLRLKDMVQDVSLILRSSQHSVTLDIRPVDLQQELQHIINDQKEYMSVPHEIRLDYQLDDQQLESDTRILRRVVANLLSNAAKYSPPDAPIDLRVRAMGRWVLLAVQDAGIGIPLDAMGTIFEPFTRANNTQDVAGIGLGLTIVRDSVALLGGTVSIQSEVGEGTTVTVMIPREPPRPTPNNNTPPTAGE